MLVSVTDYLTNHLADKHATLYQPGASTVSTLAVRIFQRPEPPASKQTAESLSRHILVAAAEPELQHLLGLELQKAGYVVTLVTSGLEVLEHFCRLSADLIILDVQLPVLDGWTVCRVLRSFSHVPIILLSGLNQPDDVVQGLAMGADDYIRKPFVIREVVARLQALLRRVTRHTDPSSDASSALHGDLHCEDFRPLPVENNQVVLDVQAHEVQVNGGRVQLTPTEFRLLSYLMSKAGQVIRKEELFRATWGNEEPLGSSQVALMVSRLRAKIELDLDNPTLITTVYGVGYQFNKLGK